MKLPKRIASILREKQAFIDSQRDKLEASVIKQQSKLFSKVVTDIVSELDVKDGVILDTPKNYRLISVLDKTYKDFQKSTSGVLLKQIANTTGEIATITKTYFEIVLSGDLPQKFTEVVAKADKLINLKIGLDGGKMLRGGYLQSLFESNTIGLELKEITSKAVTSNMNKKDFVKLLQEKIVGTEEVKGLSERQYQRYAYDIYQQYDRAYNLNLAQEFGFRYFIYQGGLITDSREFCVKHNNKVYSIEEADSWDEWISPTTKEKPSYLGYPGYEPMIDFGGYNCRHSAGWIDDALAFRLRPELEDKN